MHKRLRVFSVGVAALAAGCVLYFTYGAQSVAQAPASLGPRILLYQELDFAGPAIEVTDSLLDMPVTTDEFGANFEWNDQVRSIIVESGTWRLHQNGRYNTKLDDTALEELDVSTKAKTEGWSTLVSSTSRGPLWVPNTASGGFGADISSVELVSEESLPDWALPLE